MTSENHVLMLLTSHDVLGQTGQPTGFWLEEFATPYYIFLDAKVKVTLASIQGGQPPIDPKSNEVDSQTESTQRFKTDAIAQKALAETLSVQEVKAVDYDAIFLPGGHGTMWDFAESDDLRQLIETFNKLDKVVAAVCHAPAALVNVKGTSGEPIVKGKMVTSFTDSEEKGVQLESVVPFMLESRLRELGANFIGADDWAAHVRQDGNLITGQNPASSADTAKAVIEAI